MSGDPAPSVWPEGTIGWARAQMLAGRRVRQRCWLRGDGCELPKEVVDTMGKHYEEGIDNLSIPLLADILFGEDWEVVPNT